MFKGCAGGKLFSDELFGDKTPFLCTETQSESTENSIDIDFWKYIKARIKLRANFYNKMRTGEA